MIPSKWEEINYYGDLYGWIYRVLKEVDDNVYDVIYISKDTESIEIGRVNYNFLTDYWKFIGSLNSRYELSNNYPDKLNEAFKEWREERLHYPGKKEIEMDDSIAYCKNCGLGIRKGIRHEDTGCPADLKHQLHMLKEKTLLKLDELDDMLEMLSGDNGIRLRHRNILRDIINEIKEELDG